MTSSIFFGHNFQLSRYDTRSQRRDISIHVSTYVGSAQMSEISGTNAFKLSSSRTQKSWDSIEDPVLSEICTNILGQHAFEKKIGRNIFWKPIGNREDPISLLNQVFLTCSWREAEVHSLTVQWKKNSMSKNRYHRRDEWETKRN